MSSTLNKVLIFALGAAVGSFVTWKYLKYKQVQESAEEEIEPELEDIEERKPWSVIREEMMSDLKNITRKEDYTPDPEGGIGTMRPFIITPEEYGEFEEYDQDTLILYSDGVITDEWDNVIDDVDGTIGTESLDHFGDYERDTVFVRNDRLRVDYEIQRDPRSYAEVVGDSPHPAEDE